MPHPTRIRHSTLVTRYSESVCVLHACFDVASLAFIAISEEHARVSRNAEHLFWNASMELLLEQSHPKIHWTSGQVLQFETRGRLLSCRTKGASHHLRLRYEPSTNAGPKSASRRSPRSRFRN